MSSRIQTKIEEINQSKWFGIIDRIREEKPQFSSVVLRDSVDMRDSKGQEKAKCTLEMAVSYIYSNIKEIMRIKFQIEKMLTTNKKQAVSPIGQWREMLWFVKNLGCMKEMREFLRDNIEFQTKTTHWFQTKIQVLDSLLEKYIETMKIKEESITIKNKTKIVYNEVASIVQYPVILKMKIEMSSIKNSCTIQKNKEGLVEIVKCKIKYNKNDIEQLISRNNRLTDDNEMKEMRNKTYDEERIELINQLVKTNEEMREMSIQMEQMEKDLKEIKEKEIVTVKENENLTKQIQMMRKKQKDDIMKEYPLLNGIEYIFVEKYQRDVFEIDIPLVEEQIQLRKQTNQLNSIKNEPLDEIEEDEEESETKKLKRKEIEDCVTIPIITIDKKTFCMKYSPYFFSLNELKEKQVIEIEKGGYENDIGKRHSLLIVVKNINQTIRDTNENYPSLHQIYETILLSKMIFSVIK